MLRLLRTPDLLLQFWCNTIFLVHIHFFLSAVSTPCRVTEETAQVTVRCVTGTIHTNGHKLSQFKIPESTRLHLHVAISIKSVATHWGV